MRYSCCLVATAILIATGCDRPATPNPSAKKQSDRRASSQQTALLRAIRKELRELPEATDLVLRPPIVVLDKRSTPDGEDIEAIVQREPGVLGGPVNQIRQVRGGVDFRESVRPGDIIKYYANYDEETKRRIREGGDIGIAGFQAMDLKVAQVISDEIVLIEGGLTSETTIPTKLEVWRIADDRMDDIQRDLGTYVVKREPPLAWHPSPDAATISQLTERLNQWLRQSKLAGSKASDGASEAPPILGTLPESLTANAELAPYLKDSDRSSGYFRNDEVRQVQGAIWRRDVARWARGTDNDTVAVAGSLFDWTVRNVQLIDPSEAPPRFPWEIMLHGRAAAAGRAWVFAGLCEQQNLTAAIVVVPTEGDGQRTLVGVLDGDALRLFDPEIGLPIPGNGQDAVASLAELQADNDLLRAFDLPDEAYPLTSERMKEAEVFLIASPFSLARRAAALSGQLTAGNAVVLSADPAAITERLRKSPAVDEVSIWPLPYQTLLDKLTVKRSLRNRAVREFLPFAWRPQLWRGRTQHFRGQVATPEERAATTAETANDHRDARRYYTSRGVRPSINQLAKQPPEKKAIYSAAKVTATLNLALLMYDDGSYEVAKDWFENNTFETEAAAEHRPAVRYNLARTFEKLGETDKAIELLESIEGPSAYGAKLLAKRLSDRGAAEAGPATATEESEEDPNEATPSVEPSPGSEAEPAGSE